MSDVEAVARVVGHGLSFIALCLLIDFAFDFFSYSCQGKNDWRDCEDSNKGLCSKCYKKFKYEIRMDC